jgi:hypothetical protein
MENKNKNQINSLKFPVAKVAVHCRHGRAAVIAHTLDSESEAFSRSPYWILCPRLIQQIHQLESQGWISILQSAIDGPLKEEWEHFVNVEVPQLLEKGLDPAYFEVLQRENRLSIGGVTNKSRLKCLHAHAAFFLVHKAGIAGQFTCGMLNWKAKRSDIQDLWCPEAQPECNLGEQND